MVLNVLKDVPEVLTYLSKLKNQSVFNFCAIPQVMAIATLALVFNNLDVYQRNIKIRKGEAVNLILKSTNMDNVIAIFRQYVFEIAKKNEASEPKFMEISMTVGKVSIQYAHIDGRPFINFNDRLNNGLLNTTNHHLKHFKNLKHPLLLSLSFWVLLVSLL